MKGPQGPKAANAHLLFFWPRQTKTVLWFCHLSTLPVVSSSVGKESHVLGTQSPLRTNAGRLGGMVGNLCTQSQPRALP